MPSIFEQSIHLQALLDEIPDEEIGKNLIRNVGLKQINDRWCGSLVRAAHATDAYFMNDGLTMELDPNSIQKFGEIVLKGSVPRIGCIEVLGRSIVALPFFDAIILGPREEIETSLVEYELEGYDEVLPVDTQLKRPIYTPVESLKFITLAA